MLKCLFFYILVRAKHTYIYIYIYEEYIYSTHQRFLTTSNNSQQIPKTDIFVTKTDTESSFALYPEYE